jgi:hypothetical protein
MPATFPSPGHGSSWCPDRGANADGRRLRHRQTLFTLAAMLRYGWRRWLNAGEVFSVYTGVLATLSP